MFLLIHLQIFLCISLDSLFLVVKHWSFHAHKFSNSVSFESIEQILKSIFELLSVLIHYLRNYLFFTIIRLTWDCRNVKIFETCIFLWDLIWSYIVWAGNIFFLCIFGVKDFSKISRILFNRRVFDIFFPSFGDLFDIIEVSLFNKFFHIHLNLIWNL